MSELKATPGPWVLHPLRAWVSPEADIDMPICELRMATDGVSCEEQARLDGYLIASAPDHADIGWAMCVAAGRWEPWRDGRGEFVLNGIRFTTRLDPFGVPKVTPALRAQIARARGDVR